MARVTVYTHSVGASLLSITGYGFLATGVVTAFGGEIVAGIILVLCGAGLSFLAAHISECEKFQTWRKRLEEKGLDFYIEQDVEAAIAAYNSYPCKKVLKYIWMINPDAAEFIEQQIHSQKRN